MGEEDGWSMDANGGSASYRLRSDASELLGHDSKPRCADGNPVGGSSESFATDIMLRDFIAPKERLKVGMEANGCQLFPNKLPPPGLVLLFHFWQFCTAQNQPHYMMGIHGVESFVILLQ